MISTVTACCDDRHEKPLLHILVRFLQLVLCAEAPTIVSAYSPVLVLVAPDARMRIALAE
jgi:hypothetical protein